MNAPLLNRKPTKSTPRRFVWISIVGALLITLYWTGVFQFHSQNLPLFEPTLKLRLYTHNIRYANAGSLDHDEKRWDQRKTGVIKLIDFNTATGYANIVNLQEVLHEQLIDILTGLNANSLDGDDWTYFGVGRTDGDTKGEFAPILYKTSDWVFVSGNTYWLSPTPETPSRGWDAALERILTLVVLRLKHNPLVTISFFNTHFDHQGETARRELTKLIISKLRASEYPAFLTGDLNTQPLDVPYGLLKKSGFRDSRTLIDPRFSYGENATFTGFNRKKEESTIIDYVWSPEYSTNIGGEIYQAERFGVILRRFGVLNNFIRGDYISDHRPVVAVYDVSRRVVW